LIFPLTHIGGILLGWILSLQEEKKQSVEASLRGYNAFKALLMKKYNLEGLILIPCLLFPKYQEYPHSVYLAKLLQNFS
jgi:hypothetical protein